MLVLLYFLDKIFLIDLLLQ